MARKSGFYKVLFHDGYIIAEYDEHINKWQICGSDHCFYENDFDAIGMFLF